MGGGGGKGVSGLGCVGWGETVTARLLTNRSNALRNIHTEPERISQGHVQNGGQDTF